MNGVKKLAWIVFVLAVGFAAIKLLPGDLNITMEKVKDVGNGTTEFIKEQSDRINPEDWPEPPNLLPSQTPIAPDPEVITDPNQNGAATQ